MSFRKWDRDRVKVVQPKRRRERVALWNADNLKLALSVVLMMGGQWQCNRQQVAKTEAVVEQTEHRSELRRRRTSARIDSLQARVDSLTSRMGKSERRVRRLERKAARGTDDRESLAPQYDADTYGPQRPDPGLASAIGRLLPWNWGKGRKDGR